MCVLLDLERLGLLRLVRDAVPPANTCSFLNMRRPSGFFGSMPFTANSIARSGCSSRSFSSAIDLMPPMWPVWW